MKPTCSEPALLSRAVAYPLLGQVSRTFALTIRMLAEPLREQVSLAYLLCRLLDTFEDDPALPPPEKKAALGALCTALETGTDPGSLEAYMPQLRSPEAELELVRLAPALFRSLRALPEPVWGAVAARAAEMGRGMLAMVDDPEVRTTDDLERYC